MMKVLGLVIILCLGLTNLHAQERALGSWKMVDESSGRLKNVIKFYQKGDEYYGKIVDTNPKPGTPANPICDKCDGARKNQHVIGMDVLTGFEYDDRANEFVDGEILNPKDGKEYDAKVWVGDDGNLRVRGYKFFFHKTYTLLPSEKEF